MSDSRITPRIQPQLTDSVTQLDITIAAGNGQTTRSVEGEQKKEGDIKLTDLSNDILLFIMKNIDDPKSVARLSLTCKNLQGLYQKDYKAGESQFLTDRPSAQQPSRRAGGNSDETSLPKQDVLSEITFLDLPDEILGYLIKKIKDPIRIIHFSSTCRQAYRGYQWQYKMQERQTHTLAYNLATPALCKKLYLKLISITDIKIDIPTPYTEKEERKKLRDILIDAELTAEARQIVLLQKIYVIAWDLLLQPEVLENQSQASELIKILLDLLPHINNAQDYATHLFNDALFFKVFDLLAQRHLDRCLQMIVRYFDLNKAHEFITAQKNTPNALLSKGLALIDQAILEEVKEGGYPSFLHYALVSFLDLPIDRYEDINNLLNILFDQGCDLEQRNEEGETALIYLMRLAQDFPKKWFGYLITRLIEQGADCNAQDKNGNTILMMITPIIMRRHKDVILTLLQNLQIDVNAINNQGNSALHIAIQRHNLSLAEAFLKHEGIKLNASNNQGWTILMYASMRDFFLVQTLLEYEEIGLNAINHEGNTALHLAVETHNLSSVQVLLQHLKIDVNIRNNQGKSALAMAIEAQNLPVMEILLKREDIEVNAEMTLNDKVLRFVIQRSTSSLMQALLTRFILSPHSRLLNFIYAVSLEKDDMANAFLQDMDSQEKAKFIEQALEIAETRGELNVVDRLYNKYGATSYQGEAGCIAS
jgi:ankyrin repeat protein